MKILCTPCDNSDEEWVFVRDGLVLDRTAVCPAHRVFIADARGWRRVTHGEAH